MDEMDILIDLFFHLYEFATRKENLAPDDMDEKTLALLSTFNDEQKNLFREYDNCVIGFAINYSKSTIKFFLTGLCPYLFDEFA